MSQSFACKPLSTRRSFDINVGYGSSSNFSARPQSLTLPVRTPEYESGVERIVTTKLNSRFKQFRRSILRVDSRMGSESNIASVKDVSRDTGKVDNMKSKSFSSRRTALTWLMGANLSMAPNTFAVPEADVWNPSSTPPRVSYSAFLDLVDADQVQEVRFQASDPRGSTGVKFLLKTGTSQYDALPPQDVSLLEKAMNRVSGGGKNLDPKENAVVRVLSTNVPPADPGLISTLRSHGVNIVAATPEGDVAGLLDIVLQVALLGILFVAATGGGSGGGGVTTLLSKKFSLYKPGRDNEVFFDDVAGSEEAKEQLSEVVEFLSEPDRFLELGARVPRGVLMSGPPGTGKTLLARAAAGEAGVPFISISGSEFVELFIGLGARRVRGLFAEAKKIAPCIVFIDEIDAIGKARSSGAGSDVAGVANEEREQTLNQLLTEMDGFDSNPRVPIVILAATNRPQILDPALMRPGRLDRQITIGPPDRKGREELLKMYLETKTTSGDLDLKKVSQETMGLTGAQLANIVNEAAMLAARRQLEAVSTNELIDAAENCVVGAPRHSLEVRQSELRIVAVHEVGHAILGAMSKSDERVTKVSLVPRMNGALGFTLRVPAEDRTLVAEDELRGMVLVLMGGRAAESVIFGRVTTGATDDLQRATTLAENMVSVYGMSPLLGPRALLPPPSDGSTPAQGPRGGHMGSQASPSSALADQEVSSILRTAETLGKLALDANKQLLEEMVQQLVENETLEGAELDKFLARVEPTKEVEEWLDTGFGVPSSISISGSNGSNGHPSVTVESVE